MERLNIKDFEKIEKIETKELYIDKSFSEGWGDSKFHFGYVEENKKSGEVIRITGNKKSGYSKVISNPEKPTQETLQFDIEGNLISIATTYIGRIKKFPNGRMGRPGFAFGIGTGYLYDSKGLIINTMEFDKGYDMSIEELEKILLEKKKINLNDCATGIYKMGEEQLKAIFEKYIVDGKYDAEFSNHAPFWDIQYRLDPKDYSQTRLIVGGKTGEILYEGIIQSNN